MIITLAIKDENTCEHSIEFKYTNLTNEGQLPAQVKNEIKRIWGHRFANYQIIWRHNVLLVWATNKAQNHRCCFLFTIIERNQSNSVMECISHFKWSLDPHVIPLSWAITLRKSVVLIWNESTTSQSVNPISFDIYDTQM